MLLWVSCQSRSSSCVSETTEKAATCWLMPFHRVILSVFSDAFTESILFSFFSSFFYCALFSFIKQVSSSTLFLHCVKDPCVLYNFASGTCCNFWLHVCLALNSNVKYKWSFFVNKMWSDPSRIVSFNKLEVKCVLGKLFMVYCRLYHSLFCH